MKRIYSAILVYTLPLCTYAAENDFNKGLFPCPDGNCTFNDLIILIQGLNSTIIRVALVLSPLLLMYVGFLYMTSQDNVGKRTEAKKMLKNVLIGIALMLSGYVIVRLVLTALLDQSVLNQLPIEV